ncbi:MAG: biotin-dependent carboxyltransferase family protein [Rhodanobacteraceae bacterium]|jgi:antagonist of KipI|nr:biotin-dependent carboxyltransferase family protein [Rhodanobacteraceae bacterium]
MSVTVLKAGLLTTVQDRGRIGLAALGVGRAGPMDTVAHRLANALVGNDPAAAALEFTLLGPQLHFETTTAIALTGAAFDARLDGAEAPPWRPLAVRAGSVLEIGAARHGARGYLAIAGGFAVTPVLGSAAMDVNAGLGPFDGRPLRAGDVLATAHLPGAQPAGEAALPPASWSLDPRPWFDPDPARPLRLIRGAQFDALDAASRDALCGDEFRLAPASNRVGFRLDGPRLALAAPLELVSEPVAFGTVQLPPGGQPIVLMAEHPTTGGYPRIGQVAAIDLPRLAQRRPGAPLRFREVSLDEAQTRYLARERALARLIDTIAQRLAE